MEATLSTWAELGSPALSSWGKSGDHFQFHHEFPSFPGFASAGESLVEHTENLPSQISDPAAPSHSQQAEEELCAGEMFHPGGMSSWGQWGIELRIKSSGTFKLRSLCLIFVLWCITQTHCCHKFWKREIFKDSSNSDNSMILWNSWVQKHILSGKQTCLPLRSLKPPFILFDTHHPARKTGFIFEIPN